MSKAIGPGPGGYDPFLSNKKSSPRYMFSKMKREGINKTYDSPGPGAYRMNSKVSDIPTYSMPNKQNEFKYV
jgi:hypothetical protein